MVFNFNVLFNNFAIKQRLTAQTATECLFSFKEYERRIPALSNKSDSSEQYYFPSKFDKRRKNGKR